MSSEHPPKRGHPQPIVGGPIRFGPYWLDARIAVGGTAEVYLARPMDPNFEPKRLIVKRLLPHFAGDQEGRTMFEREAALHASVTHENVVTVFGSGLSAEGEPYLAMEFVDGVDGYRLLRRLKLERRPLSPSLAIHVTREVLSALSSVHTAKDSAGRALGIIHRDVTPSNLYLSAAGKVKLGDFGIARSTTRATLRNAASAVLKGKFAYLAPEQVAGEPFDHRADLFSMATVLAEMLLGKPLFPGGGQLAVLLAIRDCRTDAIDEVQGSLPPGLYEILKRSLARDPKNRYQTADQFAEALKPLAPDPRVAAAELGALVRFVQAAPSVDAMTAVRESARQMRAVPPAAPPDSAGAFERETGEYGTLPSYVLSSDGTKHGPWTFARLVEACATGQIGRGDKVDYMGRGYVPIEEIEELARHLPMRTATTNQLSGPGQPDFFDDLAQAPMLSVLLRILEARETGVLFAEERGMDKDPEAPPPPPSAPRSARGGGQQKELYFVDGRLHHVASSNAHELLGQYLVRRGKLAREELDLALAVLPRYSGRMGDTLISLGLVGPVDIFRAIRDQGRDRVADLFVWRTGKVAFYRGQVAPHVEFPLDLDLPSLMLAGLEAAHPGEAPLDAWQSRLDRTIALSNEDRRSLGGVAWPATVARVLSLVATPKPVREVLKTAARGGGTATPGDVIRAIEVLAAAKLVKIG
jgi:serine/threonine-protein kinase